MDICKYVGCEYFRKRTRTSEMSDDERERRKKIGGNNDTKTSEMSDDEREEKKEDRGKHDTMAPFMSSHYM